MLQTLGDLSSVGINFVPFDLVFEHEAYHNVETVNVLFGLFVGFDFCDDRFPELLAFYKIVRFRPLRYLFMCWVPISSSKSKLLSLRRWTKFLIVPTGGFFPVATSLEHVEDRRMGVGYLVICRLRPVVLPGQEIES